MKVGTLVHHALGYKAVSQAFHCLPRKLVMIFRIRKIGVKSSLNFERSQRSPRGNFKSCEAKYCRSALLLPFCENRLRLLQSFKKLNSTERGAFFRVFCVSNVIITGHENKCVSIFLFFQDLSNKKKATTKVD